jgi:KDO2-lipid IV(A) lauroyltransferase
MNALESKVLDSPINSWGKLMYRFFPYRKQVIHANIEQAFGDNLSLDAKTHLVKAFYSHLGLIIKETLQLRFLSEEKLKSKVNVEGLEHLLSVAEKGKGVLVLTGHFGNWEFAPLGGMQQFKQFTGQLHFVRRELGWKFVEKLLFKRYHNAGLRVIGKKNALDRILNALEQNHGVVFVLDQHALTVNKDGIAVEFFGKKAGTYRSLAMIANYTDVDVVPAAGYRTADNQHVLKFYPPISLIKSKDTIYDNTLRYNQILEQIILEQPVQWWWLHKRWKLKETT